MIQTDILLLVTAAITGIAHSQSYPSECVSICQPFDALLDQCEAENTTSDPDGDDEDTDDDAATRCVCSASTAATDVPSCEACVEAYGGNGDSDIDNVLTACGFTSTTYVSATQAPSSASAPTTSPLSGSCSNIVTYTSVWNTDDNDNDDDGDSTTATFTSTDFAACGATGLATITTSAPNAGDSCTSTYTYTSVWNTDDNDNDNDGDSTTATLTSTSVVACGQVGAATSNANPGRTSASTASPGASQGAATTTSSGTQPSTLESAASQTDNAAAGRSTLELSGVVAVALGVLGIV